MSEDSTPYGPVFDDLAFNPSVYKDVTSGVEQPEKHVLAMAFLDSVQPEERLNALRLLQHHNTYYKEGQAQKYLELAVNQSHAVIPQTFNGKHIHFYNY
ncbi:MAG: hypothetical protein QW303_01410 [Nitrososphaerota archaeon]